MLQAEVFGLRAYKPSMLDRRTGQEVKITIKKGREMRHEGAIKY